MAEGKLPEANVEIEVDRLWNLGGYSNTLRIRRKIICQAKDLKEYTKDLDEIMADVEVQFGDTMALSRRNIKKLAKEVFEDDGTVHKKKEE
jgi:hypothetical protein